MGWDQHTTEPSARSHHDRNPATLRSAGDHSWFAPIADRLAGIPRPRTWCARSVCGCDEFQHRGGRTALLLLDLGCVVGVHAIEGVLWSLVTAVKLRDETPFTWLSVLALVVWPGRRHHRPPPAPFALSGARSRYRVASPRAGEEGCFTYHRGSDEAFASRRGWPDTAAGCHRASRGSVPRSEAR